MNYSKKITTSLPSLMCVFLNPAPTKVECSTVNDNPNCIYCDHFGTFMISGDLRLLPSRIMFSIIVIMGICGIFMNTLIVTILGRLRFRQSFDILLLALAVLDLVACFFSVVAAISVIVIFENWSRNYFAFVMFTVGALGYLFGRSGSAFMTVLIAFERYMAIAFPFQKANIFTPKRALFMGIGSCLLSVLLSIPRFGGMYVSDNSIGKGISTIEELDVLIYRTNLGLFFYTNFKNVHDLIDIFLPLILLIGLTTMTYLKTRAYSIRRHQLDKNQKKELNGGRIFLPIVLVFFLSNLVVSVLFPLSFLNNIIYREALLLPLVSSVLNASANLPIYFLKSSGFRKEAKNLVTSWLGKLMGKDAYSHSDPSVWYITSEKGSSTATSDLFS